MERRRAHEEDLIVADDPLRILFPVVVEVEELARVGEIFAERLREGREKAIDARLVGGDPVFQ